MSESDFELRTHAIWAKGVAEDLGHRILDGTAIERHDGLRSRITMRCTRCEGLLIVLAGEERPAHHWGGLDQPCNGTMA